MQEVNAILFIAAEKFIATGGEMNGRLLKAKELPHRFLGPGTFVQNIH